MLKFATFAYNNSIHATTNFTPHELAHGFRIKITSHLTKPKIIYNYENFADITRNNIAKALELAKEHLYAKKIENKKYYDKKINNLDVEIDDMILVKNFTKNHKFDHIYDGPFRVINVNDNYIEFLKNGKKMKIHKNFVKKQVSNTINTIQLQTNEDKLLIYFMKNFYNIDLDIAYILSEESEIDLNNIHN